ncbi:GNAT family N-acetyltransferase [Candidatus Latescibacterota bacterium]
MKRDTLMDYEIIVNGPIESDEVIALYNACGWSAAKKPDKLMAALRNSDTLVTARIAGMLVGICNSISDGHLVVYYPHMLVHPDYQRHGIGRAMMEKMQEKYSAFHQQMLTADGNAILFYEALGFRRAGKTEPMWIYDGDDH